MAKCQSIFLAFYSLVKAVGKVIDLPKLIIDDTNYSIEQLGRTLRNRLLYLFILFYLFPFLD